MKTTQTIGIALALASLLSFSNNSNAGIAYAPPPGGWTYVYTGDSAAGAPRRQNQPALDGTWRHEVSSDEWNGDPRGAAFPPRGGVESNNGVLTIEDAETTGSGNNNNRKIYFIHSIAQDGVTVNNLLDSGVTITFRARLTPPDDKAEIPLPNGYGIFSSGKGMFGVRQSNPSSIISFSLVLQNEDGDASNSLAFRSAGLTMNRNNGDTPNSTGSILQGVNSSNDPNLNPIVPLDPTQWHEFWITIQANDATPGNGTHTVTVYVDGSVVGNVFNVTAGTGSDVDSTVTPSWTDYIAMGLNNSPTVGAFDVDFFGYKPGVYAPVPLTPPSAPTNITVINGDSRVQLLWNQVLGADSYIVRRSGVPGGPYSIITALTTTNYTDLNVVNGNTYYYVITATNAAGESPFSAEVIGRPSLAVTGVQATGGTNQVIITWNSFGQAQGYIVSRSEVSGGPFTAIASNLTETQYIDTAVVSGRTYYYVVYAQLAGGEISGISNESTATTAPSAPTLTGALFAATAIRVNWTTTDRVVSQFIIERSTDGINFSPIQTLAGTVRGFTNTSLAFGTTYYYRIQAQNAGGYSDYSQVVSVKTPTLGVNVNFANAAAPVPPGYVQDIGELLGDRGNGYYYGWTTPSGNNITADARYRQNANSPDLRYDTFNHMMKANVNDPSLGAVWQIELPNGFYLVRIVAGDPTATDSVFQFDVEGILTETYTPVSGAWWGDFSLTVPVLDGMLTVKSGPLARNNKINFIDIYSTIPTLPEITWQPQSATVLENRSVSFSINISGGTRPVYYQWYFNAVPIANANSQTLTIPLPKLTDAGEYYVVITNYAGSLTSDVARLTVLQDTEPPRILSSASLDGTNVAIVFDEIINIQEASDIFNYDVMCNNQFLTITGVQIRNDNKSVLLTIDPATPATGSYIVYAKGISDIASSPNQIPIDIPVSYTGIVANLTAMDIGVYGSTGFSGTGPTLNMLYPGSTFNFSNGAFTVSANGYDIWNTVDGFHYVFRPVTGDFDVRVRVESMTRPDNWAKAGLMVRPSTNENSRFIAIIVTPTTGQNNIAFQWRDTDGAGCGSIHGGSGGPAISPPYPNAWLRLQRVGSFINGYWSSNGVDWLLYTNRDTALFGGALPDTVLVGMAATSHNQPNLTNNVIVEFRDFSIEVAPPPVFSIVSPQLVDGVFSVKVQSIAGRTYTLQSTDSLTTIQWTDVGQPVQGTGSEITLTDTNLVSQFRFYRVKME